MRVGDAKTQLEASGIQLEVGQTAKLILNQNLSTGYEWSVNEEASGSVFDITQKNENGYSPNHYVGVGGSKVILITATEEGESTL